MSNHAADTLLELPLTLERAPPPFEGNDIKYPESLPRYFITRYSRRGARVFDPFAGLGTTLFVAEELGRKAYGVEADPRRHEWVAGQLENWMGVLCADSARVARLGFPKMDMAMTSPPFMPMTDKWNPLCGGNPAQAGYAAYLKRLALIFRQMTGVMKKGAPLVVHVDNIAGRRFTPLVRDMGAAVAQSWRQTDEVVVRGQGDGRHTRCLIFKNDMQKDT